MAEVIDAAARATGVSEIRLIDNASTDGVPEQVAQSFAADGRFRFEKLAENIGFGAACNRGAATCTARWLLFLNPDCRVTPATLDTLIERADQADTPGVIGIRTMSPVGEMERAVKRLMPSTTRMMLRQRHAPLDFTLPWQTVEAGSGALMLVPRALFERIGGFDRGFFLHAEDLDLMARARLAGARNALAADLTATHHQGTSSRKRPWFVAWHKHRSMIRFLARHPRHFGDVLLWPLMATLLWCHFLFVAARLLLRRK